jgi:G3E family GTPase
MTPLILLVGFLGSGKTTYLRRLLPELRGRGIEPHVIINDHRNAGVDAELLREFADSVVPISGSCVCCGSRDELLGALEKFVHAPDRVVVIETNGTTDSSELITMLSLDPALARFTQPIQLSLVDAQRWQKRFWHNPLELAQTRTANFLFVSRWDEISPERREKVEASLAGHGLHCERLAPDGFAEKIHDVLASVRDVPARDAVPHPAGCGCGHHPAAFHAAHHFASLQVDLPQAIPRAALAAFLDRLPREVIRVKGLARLSESPGEFHVFQRVDDSPIQWLPVGPSPRVGRPLAVLIGPEIESGPILDLAAELFRAATG